MTKIVLHITIILIYLIYERRNKSLIFSQLEDYGEPSSGQSYCKDKFLMTQVASYFFQIVLEINQ